MLLRDRNPESCRYNWTACIVSEVKTHKLHLLEHWVLLLLIYITVFFSFLFFTWPNFYSGYTTLSTPKSEKKLVALQYFLFLTSVVGLACASLLQTAAGWRKVKFARGGAVTPTRFLGTARVLDSRIKLWQIKRRDETRQTSSRKLLLCACSNDGMNKLTAHESSRCYVLSGTPRGAW